MKQEFFKIVLEDGTIELPKEFVKEYGKDLSKYVSLEVPISGAPSYKVELERSNGRIWLRQGWNDFVNCYSIKYADFLVFKYQGESSFQVIIFNKGCSEIDYPISGDDDNDDDEEEKEASMADVQSRLSSRGFDESMARERVVQRAKAYDSESPNLCFISNMRRAYLSRSFLYIPAGCPVRNYFYGRDENHIRVSGPDGRDVLMKYYLTGPPLNQVRIVVGWREFVKDYRLEDGDACVFELLNTKDMEFRVTIFRLSEEDSKR